MCRLKQASELGLNGGIRGEVEPGGLVDVVTSYKTEALCLTRDVPLAH